VQLLHARLDHQHAKDFDEILDSLPMSEEHAGIIGASAFISAYWISQLYEDLMESWKSRQDA
jgi:hypothetical protein